MTERSGAPGSVTEELARLLEAATGYARQSLGEAWGAAGSSPECQFCPFCRLLGILRERHPDAGGHLAAAVAELVAALRNVADPAAPAPAAPDPAAPDPAAPPAPVPVRIDIS